MDERDVYAEVLAVVEAAPHSAPALVYYALMKTLSSEQGHLFLLDKLCHLEHLQRRTAYQLMELMARGRNREPAWRETLERIEEILRSVPP